jgi:hypothetical protein
LRDYAPTFLGNVGAGSLTGRRAAGAVMAATDLYNCSHDVFSPQFVCWETGCSATGGGGVPGSVAEEFQCLGHE